MKVLRTVAVVIGAVALVLIVRYVVGNSEPEGRRGPGGPTTVAVEVVRLDEFADRTEAIGTVVANESVVITPPVTERVASIHFEDGEHVEKGQLLVELDHAEESATVEEARVSFEEEQRQFARVRSLHENDLVSDEELDAARADLEASQARLHAAEARLRNRLIEAPFEGVLGIRRVSPGALVTPGDVITTLDDLRVVKVDFTVPEALLSQVGEGQSIVGRASAWPEERFEGRVTGIDSRVDPTTRAVGMQATIPNRDGLLRSGMLLTIELTCCPRESVSVPERALLSYADRQYVFVVRGGETAEQREVALGARSVGRVEVTGGLAPGDTVVVDGLLSLRDGAQVAVESDGGDAR
jgi:membrane fusion protein (multidrug efflux system)